MRSVRFSAVLGRWWRNLEMVMNREQRRKAAREDAKQRKAMWPNGFCTVPPELAPTLKTGDKFTIAGLRRRKDGTYTLRCKPGNETVFTAQEEKPQNLRPAIRGKREAP
jgi:hypothetical protein